MAEPKYKQTTSNATVYLTSKKSFGINIPIKIVRDMQLQKGESIEVTFKKIEENYWFFLMYSRISLPSFVKV